MPLLTSCMLLKFLKKNVKVTFKYIKKILCLRPQIFGI